ncbi:MAG: sulfurtransferase-like selenium metabolism protein YedF [Candidatus Cloacimonadales bacterium]|nr:sulfurtransferase-like selenium metabolism protein YedF [Candidatus Cloacimonadales bacterium]
MKKLIDACGLSCPQPVVQTMKALKEGDFDELEIIVDNVAARENVSRFLKKAEVEITKIEEAGKKIHIFARTVKKVESTDFDANEYPCPVPQKNGKTIFIAKDAIGSGSEELGQKLMKAFLFTLTEMETKPARIMFMNSGVKLCTEGNAAVQNLKSLVESGTEILVCGTCLDYFGISDKLEVGIISNMYDIAGHLLGDDGVVKI